MSAKLGRGINYTRWTEEQEFELGARAYHSDGVFEYCQAQGALDAYEGVKVDVDFQAIPLTSTVSGTEPTAVGAPQADATDNYYGWIFRGMGGGDGRGIKMLITDSISHGAKLTTTATPGVLGSGGDTIQNVVSVDTTAGSGGPHATEVFAMGLMTTNCQD